MAVDHPQPPLPRHLPPLPPHPVGRPLQTAPYGRLRPLSSQGAWPVPRLLTRAGRCFFFRSVASETHRSVTHRCLSVHQAVSLGVSEGDTLGGESSLQPKPQNSSFTDVCSSDRRPGRAWPPLCLVMSARRVCLATRGRWGLPSCLRRLLPSPQLRPQPLPARWVCRTWNKFSLNKWNYILKEYETYS